MVRIRGADDSREHAEPIGVRILPFGERAVLVEVGSLAEVLELRRRLAPRDGVVDIVPAARTILVSVDPRMLSPAAARTWIERCAQGEAAESSRGAGAEVEIPIRYDGADLPALAEVLGMSPEALAARHASARWSVAFTGFAPGFAYLVSADWPFDVPRLDSPRTRVPAGAVGVAGEFTGAYPRDTPGGWQLIGSTSARLFEPDAASPALLVPGMRVTFTTDERRAPASTSTVERGVDRAPARPAVRIVEPGLLATVQDQGRPGRAAEGIATSGAADRSALRTAHRLLGTAETAAGVEVTMGGFRAVALTDLWFAVTGAWGPVRLEGREVDPYEAHPWREGADLHLDWFTHGARAYLAVRGGFEVPPAAGSRSTDTMSRLGHEPLRAGDELPLAHDAVTPIPVDDLRPWSPPRGEPLEVSLGPGPRADWFDPHALTQLFETEWTVSNDADRVGIRLDGPELRRARAGELPSEGMVPGAVQVPTAGRPVILGPDGPVTGGYPVIAVVAEASRDALAQARPGTRLVFRHARG